METQGSDKDETKGRRRNRSNRWAIIGCRGVPGGYGGFETFADQFARRAGEFGIDLIVVCDRSVRRDVEYGFCRRVFLPLPANGALGILYDIASILYCVVTGRDILLLGCSGAIALPLTRLRRLSVVTNTAGIEWGRSKWGPLAQWFLRISEATAARWSHALVADNEGISMHLAKAYGRQSSVIAYGGDHLPYAEALPFTSNSLQAGLMVSARDSFLAVARCQPDNNVEEILRAFAASSQRLIFVSNWKGSKYGERMIGEYSDLPNVQLVDPIYDVDVLGYMRRQCIAYVHGHSAGGTNPSLVEAMWGQRNCLCFDNEFNRFTTRQDGLFWNDAAELEGLLDLEYEAPDLVKRAHRLRATAEREYNWSAIVGSYAKLLGSLS